MFFLKRLLELPAFPLGPVLMLLATVATASNLGMTALLDDVIDGPHRSEENRARDQYRHPKETLLFFGLKPEMTVVEISPGAGWYTEIIAPVLRQKGKFIAAVPALSLETPDTFKRRDAAYKNMLISDPILYGSSSSITFDPAKPSVALPGSADMVLTFRNVHNWAKAGTSDSMFTAFYEALKPGGILGVVEHRAKPGTSFQQQINSGYMTEAYVIATAQRAGFKLIATSEINRNPRDTADYPGGVWTLPPSLRGVSDKDKPQYLMIGESDRMTLKFHKN